MTDIFTFNLEKSNFYLNLYHKIWIKTILIENYFIIIK